MKDIPLTIFAENKKDWAFHEHIDLEEYPTEILLGDKVYTIQSVTTTDNNDGYKLNAMNLTKIKEMVCK